MMFAKKLIWLSKAGQEAELMSKQFKNVRFE